MDFANGLKQLRAGAEWLQHITLGTSRHRFLQKVDALLGRDHDDRAMRGTTRYQPGGLDAVEVWHVDVHQDDVRLELGRAANRFLTTGRGGDKLHVGLSANQHGERFPNGGTVVHREHTDGRRRVLAIDK